MATERSEREGVTEQVNPRTTDLDRLSLRAILERIADEDARVAGAVRAALPALEAAAAVLCQRLADGGRWFNVGAGTSGRLGALDAVELPATFGIEPDRVQAIVAGGLEALARAVEGAEDDTDAAERELRSRNLSARDAVLALSASGHTPFVLAAVAYARRVGAPTLCITCDPDAPLAAQVDTPIVIAVGPEVVTGSTRMKGGLSQKMALHSLSTAVMVKLGRVRGNLMTEIAPVNSKLRRRAARILARLAHLPLADAEAALEQAGGSVSSALERLGVPRRQS